MIRKTTCQLTRLGSVLRIPTSVDGMAHYMIQAQPLISDGGPQYLAPELLQNDHFDGYATDLWAAGIMLFVMLLGEELLFAAPVIEDWRFQKMCGQGRLKALVRQWESSTDTTAVTDDSARCSTPAVKLALSENALDLLQEMLRANPRDRLTLSQVREHAWMQNAGEPLTVPVRIVGDLDTLLLDA
jgi:serine/threonine protein kinase